MMFRLRPQDDKTSGTPRTRSTGVTGPVVLAASLMPQAGIPPTDSKTWTSGSPAISGTPLHRSMATTVRSQDHTEEMLTSPRLTTKALESRGRILDHLHTRPRGGWRVTCVLLTSFLLVSQLSQVALAGDVITALGNAINAQNKGNLTNTTLSANTTQHGKTVDYDTRADGEMVPPDKNSTLNDIAELLNNNGNGTDDDALSKTAVANSTASKNFSSRNPVGAVEYSLNGQERVGDKKPKRHYYEAINQTNRTVDNVTSAPAVNKCPNCGGHKHKADDKKGKSAGEQFLIGCCICVGATCVGIAGGGTCRKCNCKCRRRMTTSSYGESTRRLARCTHRGSA